MAFAYYQIVSYYIHSRKSKEQEDGREASSSLSDNEKKLIYKALAVCGAFAIGWFPILLSMLYQMASKEKVGSVLDTLVTIPAMLEPCFNAIVLYRFDMRIKREINAMFASNSALSRRMTGLFSFRKLDSPTALALSPLHVVGGFHANQMDDTIKTPAALNFFKFESSTAKDRDTIQIE